MINGKSQVSRKTLNDDRIAICPQFGCRSLEKVKPLKFGLLGFRRYPKCPKHKIALIFVDEFIGDFLCAVKACLFDFSSIPPKNLIHLIKTKFPNELIAFINGWMYCIPIGRGAQIVSQYMDGLSRAYMKLLSRKQRKALKNEKSSTKRYNMLRLALKKIAAEYTAFLQELRENSEVLYDPENLHPLSKDMQKLLKKWLKDHLKTIKSLNSIGQSKSSTQEDFLSVLKEEYDKVLHAGTCALLLGKNPSIVTKAVPAFELFSAYHEFLKAGICRKITRADVKSLIEETQNSLNGNEENLTNNQENEEKDLITELDNMNNKNNDYDTKNGINVKILNSNVLNFREKVGDNLKTLLASIKSTQEHKEIILSKSLQILDDFISRAENNELKISSRANPSAFAGTIVYTVTISNENMPEITQIQLNTIGIKQKDDILRLYNKYFRDLYPRNDFNISYYQGLKEISKVVSSYFFNLLREKEINTVNVVLQIKNKILENNFSEYLKQEQTDILNEILVHYEDVFEKYFQDLAETVSALLIQSRIIKKIGANFIVKPLADYLAKKNINLFYSSTRFYYSIIDIYDYLRESYPNLPPRSSISKNLPKKERWKIKMQQRDLIGNKLKLYVMEHIYNGKYFIDGSIRCPKCRKEGLEKNTDISRLTAIDFHHSTEQKEAQYSARKLSRIFEKSGYNPFFLEDLISKMESDRVEVICRVHHQIKHSNYYKNFKYLINWEDIPKKFPQNIFSLPAELIYFLVNNSIDNFHLTKNLSKGQKSYIFFTVLRYLKKRYIIESLHGEYCHTCKEFNTKNHLPSLDFHHLKGRHFHENPYVHSDIKTASNLYIRGAYTCAEIARILKFEEGGYLCKNCHSVINYSTNRLKLLKNIYDNTTLEKKVLEDYNFVKKQFTLIQNINSVGTPLKKNILITDVLKEYLNAFYEISNRKAYVTVPDLKKYFKNQRHETTIRRTLKNNKFFRFFVDVVIGKQNLKKYYLTEKGRKYIELIHYFKDYYKNY